MIVDSFMEEATDAARQTGCTVGNSSRDAVLGIYGAPRYLPITHCGRSWRPVTSFKRPRSCILDFIGREKSFLLLLRNLDRRRTCRHVEYFHPPALHDRWRAC